LNVTIGLTLLLFGVLFSLTPSKGMSPGLHTFFLVLYVFLSGLYLSKAFKQYRSRQQS
jgi:FtsH-binding integral membrane protein